MCFFVPIVDPWYFKIRSLYFILENSTSLSVGVDNFVCAHVFTEKWKGFDLQSGIFISGNSFLYYIIGL